MKSLISELFYYPYRKVSGYPCQQFIKAKRKMQVDLSLEIAVICLQGLKAKIYTELRK